MEPDSHSTVRASLAASALSSPEVESIHQSTMAWAREYSSTARLPPEAKFRVLALVSAVYAVYCAPRFADPRSVEVAARFVLLFLLVDDADVSELPSLIDDSTELWRIGPHTALLRRWLDELPELATCREPLRARFERSFHDYLQARAKEEGQKGTALTLDAHWEFRRHTIFTEPFLDQWIVSLGLDRDGAAEANLREARQLATDIVLLSNDLGSAARDTQQGEAPDDLNLIDTYARVRGWTREQTIEELIQQEREMVERYRALTSSEGKTDSFVSYVELLTALVDGNLASIYALDFRYRGVHHILDRLSMAEPNALRPASVATRD